MILYRLQRSSPPGHPDRQAHTPRTARILIPKTCNSRHDVNTATYLRHRQPEHRRVGVRHHAGVMPKPLQGLKRLGRDRHAARRFCVDAFCRTRALSADCAPFGQKPLTAFYLLQLKVFNKHSARSKQSTGSRQSCRTPRNRIEQTDALSGLTSLNWNPYRQRYVVQDERQSGDSATTRPCWAGNCRSRRGYSLHRCGEYRETRVTGRKASCHRLN